ncbi:MAG: hypothetical protein ACI8RZ_001596 [Myxococcota bacterium]|jgi:hypothetical protein
MLVKWIVCEVEPDRRAAFSEAQRAWSSLTGASGFLGQLGGWDEAGRACVVGLWQDVAHYQHFMATLHDAIADRSGQEGTYTACVVGLFERRLDIGAPPRAVGEVLDADLARITGHLVTLEPTWTVAP